MSRRRTRRANDQPDIDPRDYRNADDREQPACSRQEHVTRACPGDCNRAYRKAAAAAAREIQIAHDNNDDQWNLKITDHPVRPCAGKPYWCDPCAARIVSAIGRLPELAAALFERTSGMVDADVPQPVQYQRTIAGHGVTLEGELLWLLDCGHTHPARLSSHVPVGLIACSDCLAVTEVDAGKIAAAAPAQGGSKAKRIVSPSGSPAWDAIDELVSWAGEYEHDLRALLGHSQPAIDHWIGSARIRARVLSESVSYLTTWSSALLSAPTLAEEAGRRFLQLERRAERAAGMDWLVHRLPAPCPSCDRKALVRDDGSDQVDCKACHRSWPESDYRRLTLILTSDLDPKRRGA